jgi:ligand-binding SRPBCC domain-containing protein
LEENTLMEDVVKYKVVFGSLANKLFVKRNLRRIFEYRQRKIQEIFKK